MNDDSAFVDTNVLVYLYSDVQYDIDEKAELAMARDGKYLDSN